jgi:16S rRNA C967 or C1407 C5-methylase (RsmB/RsmF family)
MTQLPEEFIRYTREIMGEDRFSRYLLSFNEPVPVSIRLNPLKADEMTPVEGEPVPWCRHAYYLPSRPNFTFDPLLHAGCYYVQEAASMFLDQVLQQYLSSTPIDALDLCAAPGGKSTLLRAALPEGSTLYSNEPMRTRASILAENIQKWGYRDHIVTNNFPRDFHPSHLAFDLILCDVPCSGEGMFRKDKATISEWSPQNVEKCRQLQREIVSDIWPCLRTGGMMIYSTCTFNTRENEENVRWICETFNAELLPVPTAAEWHITGSLLPGYEVPVFRFIPGITHGEGLFMAAIRKKGEAEKSSRSQGKGKAHHRQSAILKMLPPEAGGPPLAAPSATGKYSSAHASSASSPVPSVEIDYPTAMAFLRGEAVTLSPDTARGVIAINFEKHPLGMVKNIGHRANNLSPKPWRIKTTHIPHDYETILRHT